MDELELLNIQIKSYEFYAGLIERAVGGGASAKLPRWDEQRALEYRELAEQLRQKVAEIERQRASSPAAAASATADIAADASAPAPAHS